MSRCYYGKSLILEWVTCYSFLAYGKSVSFSFAVHTNKNDNQQDNIDTWKVQKEIHGISFKIVQSEIMNVLYQIIRFLRHEKNNGYVIPFSLISLRFLSSLQYFFWECLWIYIFKKKRTGRKLITFSEKPILRWIKYESFKYKI